MLLTHAVLTSLKALCDNLVKSLCKPMYLLSTYYLYMNFFPFRIIAVMCSSPLIGECCCESGPKNFPIAFNITGLLECTLLQRNSLCRRYVKLSKICEFLIKELN